MGGDRGAHDRGDPELPRDDRGMRRNAAGVGHKPTDLREQDDPGRVRHLAHENLALLDLVEVVNGRDDTRGALGDTGRGGEPDDLVDRRGRLAVELLREAPERQIRERERLLRGGAEPLGRPYARLPLALVAPRGDERL